MGTKLKSLLEGLVTNQEEKSMVAVVANKRATMFDPAVVDTAHQATVALRTRLQALLQSSRMARCRHGYQGKLDTRRLHTLSTGNAKLFLQRGERAGLNTAIHILLDSSGSMSHDQMQLASLACYAVASSLRAIPGISIGVTAFPGGCAVDAQGGRVWQTVSPILQHNEPFHSRFNVQSVGGTPLDSALLWVLQQVHFLPEERKIILILTDGEPNNHLAADKAISAIKNLGHEIYGMGIMHNAIRSLLPNESRVISDIHELAPAIFELLQGKLIPKQA